MPRLLRVVPRRQLLEGHAEAAGVAALPTLHPTSGARLAELLGHGGGVLGDAVDRDDVVATDGLAQRRAAGRQLAQGAAVLCCVCLARVCLGGSAPLAAIMSDGLGTCWGPTLRRILVLSTRKGGKTSPNFEAGRRPRI